VDDIRLRSASGKRATHLILETLGPDMRLSTNFIVVMMTHCKVSRRSDQDKARRSCYLRFAVHSPYK
jgi:hypothetical protein